MGTKEKIKGEEKEVSPGISVENKMLLRFVEAELNEKKVIEEMRRKLRLDHDDRKEMIALYEATIAAFRNMLDSYIEGLQLAERNRKM